MNKDHFIQTPFNTPFIPQRADPYILHRDGSYYFTASVPAYDCIVLRAEKEVWFGKAMTLLPNLEVSI